MTSRYKTTAFKGAIFTVSMRWSDRLIGLVSTMILARLLTPADFGLVAMAMVVVGLIDVLLDLGVGAALIQNQNAGREDFDTAWTLQLGQASIAALVVFLAAPLVAQYYGDARVTDIVRLVAVNLLVGGLTNIGVVLFQKDMEFGREFRFLLTKRVVGTTVTIAIALWLRSYWALVIGSLVNRSIGVVLSYLMHSYRPRLSLAAMHRIWSFSQWNILASAFGYMTGRIDQFVIGRRGDADILGAYSIGGEIATMPSTELLAPLGRVMFPAFALAKDRPIELLRLVLLSLSVQTLIAVPASIGMVLVAREAVPLLLGGRWGEAVPFIQILAFGSMIWAMMGSSNYVLLALGRIRTLALNRGLSLVLLTLTIAVLLPDLDARGIAIARMAVGAVSLVVISVCSAYVLPGFGLAGILRSVWRPCLASGLMAGSVMGFSSILIGLPILVVMLLKVVVGVLTYGLAVLVAWRLAGSPEGGETYLLDKLRIRRYFSAG